MGLINYYYFFLIAKTVETTTSTLKVFDRMGLEKIQDIRKQMSKTNNCDG